MSAAHCQLNDPTLFLFASFVRHPALDDPVISEVRSRRVRQALAGQHWIPQEQEWLRSDAEVDHVLRRYWQHPVGDPRLSDNWEVTTFGVSYHETLGVLLGVTQSGLYRASLSEWLMDASACWTATFEQNTPWPPPDIVDNRDVLGRAWIWTGEWGDPPEDGWDQFGRREYPDGYVVLPWGLLGYRASTIAVLEAGPDNVARFDLHVVHADDDMTKRDIFLLTTLIVVLTEFVKVTSYIWPRYQREQPLLMRDQRTIMTQYDPELKPVQELLQPATRASVHELNRTLFPLTRRLGNLQHDLLSVTMAQDIIYGQLEAHEGQILRGASGSHFVTNVDVIAHQMASDIAYFKTAEQCGKTTMQALQLEVEIDNTHAEHMILSAQLLLAGLAIGIATAVGAWPIVQELVPTSVIAGGHNVYGLVCVGIVLLLGLVTGYLCWRWWIWKLPAMYTLMRKRFEADPRPSRPAPPDTGAHESEARMSKTR